MKKSELKSLIKACVKELMEEAEMPTYYNVEYYATVGQHGSIGDYPTFDKAMRVAKGRVKEFLADDEIEYFGISGNGPEFAIFKMTNDYYKRIYAGDFDTSADAKKFMQAAQKVLKTGKPVIGKYS